MKTQSKFGLKRRMAIRAHSNWWFKQMHAVAGQAPATPLDGLTLPLECLSEYDGAARWCAQRGLKGTPGDPLPDNMDSDGALKYIQADPEAFAERVKQFAYAIAQSAPAVDGLSGRVLELAQAEEARRAAR